MQTIIDQTGICGDLPGKLGDVTEEVIKKNYPDERTGLASGRSYPMSTEQTIPLMIKFQEDVQ